MTTKTSGSFSLFPAPISNKVDFLLKVYHLQENDITAKLVKDHGAYWQSALTLFVKKHVRIMYGSKKSTNNDLMRLNTPLNHFPVTSSGDTKWYGKDLSRFFDVIPSEVELNDNQTSNFNEKAFQFDSFITEIREVKVTYVEGKQNSQLVNNDDLFDSSENDDSKSDINYRVPSLSALLFFLSCMIQYADKIYGPYSIHSTICLRPFIIPEIVKILCHPNPRVDEINPTEKMNSGQHNVHQYDECWMRFHQLGNSGFVEFEKGILENCLEEWSTIGMSKRSGGLIIHGQKSVGKRMFCRDFIRLMIEVAPWMVKVVRHDSGSCASKFFDGACFVENVCNDGKIKKDSLSIRTKQSFAGPIGTKCMIELFQSIKTAAQPGKIVVTIIENLDTLAKCTQAQCVFSQLQSDTEKSGADFFILGTSGNHGGAIDSSNGKLFAYLNKFRTLKVYAMPLRKSYDFVLRQVKYPAPLAFPRHIIKRIHRCAEAAYLCENPAYRSELEKRLHNMNVMDLQKLSLHICLVLARLITENMERIKYLEKEKLEFAAHESRNFVNEIQFSPTVSEHKIINPENQLEKVFQKLFYLAFEKVLNNVNTISGLSPACVASFDWIRHDSNSHPSVHKAIETIFQRTFRFGQIIHFVKLENEQFSSYTRDNSKHPDTIPCNDDNISIPSLSSQSFLHNLHQRFGFRSSYNLRTPEQLLPHHPKLSANIPLSSVNPFNGFYWDVKQSLLVIDSLESVIGYHENMKRYVSSGFETKDINTNMVKTGYGISRSIGIGAGVLLDQGQNWTNGEQEIESTVKGESNGSANLVSVSMNPSFWAAIDKQWSKNHSLGKTMLQSISKSKNILSEMIINASIGYNEQTGLSHSNTTAFIKGDANGHSHSRMFQHKEAMTKLIVGLKSVLEKSNNSEDETRNIIIIFYEKSSTFEEIGLKRLCWNINGSYMKSQVGCSHYVRQLRMKSPCCGSWVNCEHCHNDSIQSHRMNVMDVTQIQCLHCFTKQELNGRDSESGLRCSNNNCLRKFSISCCTKCKLWRDYLPPCGFKHCDMCETCYPGNYLEFHKKICVRK